MTQVTPDFYDSSLPYSDASFSLAFGITENGFPNDSSEKIVTIKAYKRTWDFSKSPKVEYSEIKSKPCTKSELGLVTKGPVEGTLSTFF